MLKLEINECDAIGMEPTEDIQKLLLHMNNCVEMRTVQHKGCTNLQFKGGRLNLWLDENGLISRISRG